MARETTSEKLVRASNTRYATDKKAMVKKNDPTMRIAGGRVIWSATTGLDYSGSTWDGKHLEFEVKETQKDSLSLSGVAHSQLDRLKELEEMKAEGFLLVYFSRQCEWYRLSFPRLDDLVSHGYGSIPIDYFRAFGLLVPFHRGWPEYLSPEQHPYSNQLVSTYPSWMPKPTRPRKSAKMISYDVTNEEERRRRILKAMARGIKNARRRELRTEDIKRAVRKKHRAEAEGSSAKGDLFKNRD